MPSDKSKQSPAPEEQTNSEKWFKLPLENEICYFGLASAMDFFITFILLQFEQFRESNGIANYVLKNWGTGGMAAFKLAIVVFVVLTALLAEHQRKGAGRFILILGTILVTCVVLYGISLYVRYSGFY